MARTTDNVLLTCVGREVSVLSTKAVMAQIVSLLLLALDLARVNGNSSPRTEQSCRYGAKRGVMYTGARFNRGV